MKNKLLIICGPKATGKTSLALGLAQNFNSELISADSRQVYKNMDIGTGKDIPAGYRYQTSVIGYRTKKIGYYANDKIKIWGYDLVEPHQDFSVSHYLDAVKKIIGNIYNRQRLPILVGGAGLYIKGVVDGIDTTDIKRNLDVRESLSDKSTDDLYNLLANIDMKRALQLNESDKKNPRRLIRAIEISSTSIATNMSKMKRFDPLFIGLTAKKELLDTRIKQRVFERLDQGIINEAKNLLTSGVTWNSHAMMASGYRQLKDYFEGKTSLEQATNDWILAERQYAKRQMTWFKKDSRIQWFDVTVPNFQKSIEKMIKKWHNIKT